MNQNQNITSLVSVRKDWYCKKGLVLQERIGTARKDWYCKKGLVLQERIGTFKKGLVLSRKDWYFLVYVL